MSWRMGVGNDRIRRGQIMKRGAYYLELTFGPLSTGASRSGNAGILLAGTPTSACALSTLIYDRDSA